ncbi:MAG: phosphopyruvate hydratase, partial [Chloroflexota bacterium]
MPDRASEVTIASVRGREVLDSRGNPTVEAEVRLSNGVCVHAAVPSGASTGSYEALEMRDKDPLRYHGAGVLRAVSNVDQLIAPALAGLTPLDQNAIDQRLIALDGSPDKSNLGANAILAVSLAVARAAAASVNTPPTPPNQGGEREGVHKEGERGGIPLWRYLSENPPVSPLSKGGQRGVGHGKGGRAKRAIRGVTLPVPMFNILNGGRHASNSTDIQEFMVVPVGAPTFAEALRTGAEIYHGLRTLLRSARYNLNVGDEGGFAPSLTSNREALEMVLRAVEAAGYAPGRDVYLALDVAASELFRKDTASYVLEREGTALTSQELVELYARWVNEYPIISIEDGLDEDDWDGWAEMRQRLGHKVQLVGDDLYATNIERIRRGIEGRASNAVLLKPNQIGTLTETYDAFRL